MQKCYSSPVRCLASQPTPAHVLLHLPLSHRHLPPAPWQTAGHSLLCRPPHPLASRVIKAEKLTCPQ